MTTPIAVLLDACRSELALAYTPGDARFHLKSGATASIAAAYSAFGLTLGAGFPLRFTVADRTANDVNVPGVTRWVEYTATGIDGNDLTGVAVSAGHTDAAMSVGDKFFVGWSAGYFNDAAAAIRETQSDITSLRSDMTAAQTAIQALGSGGTVESNEIWVTPNTDITHDSAPDILAAIAVAEAAVAAAPSAEGFPVRTVRLRPGFYNLKTMSGPIRIPPGVGLVGSARDTTIYQNPIYQHAAFYLGLDDPACVEADRPDLYGVMDSSFCPTPGARRGMSGVNGKSVFFEHNDLNLGRMVNDDTQGRGHTYFERDSALSLDIAFKAINGPGVLAAGTVIAGMGDVSNHGPSPWLLYQDYNVAGALQFAYATDNRAYEYGGADGNATIYLPPGTGRLIRLSVWVDLVARQAHAWINGVKCVVQHAQQSGATTHFRDNPDWPLHLGRENRLVGSPVNLMFCGLRMGTTQRYDLAGASGSTQTQVGGGAVNDAYRFLEAEGGEGMVGYVPFTDPVGSRFLTSLDGRRLPNAGVITTGGASGGLPIRLKDFALWSDGSGVWLGTVLDFAMDDVYINAASGPAVGSIAAAVSYPLVFRNCSFSSLHAPLYGNGWDVRARDCKFPANGRWAALFRQSSVLIDSPSVNAIRPNGACVAAFQMLSDEYGGAFVVRGGAVDNEDGAQFRHGIVDVWGRKGNQTFTYVEVDGLYSAAGSVDHVGVRLHTVPNNGGSRQVYRVPTSNWWNDGSTNVVADAGWDSV